jgi:hypothetical protein
MSDPWGVRFGARLATAALTLGGVVACSGAATTELLAPPPSSSTATAESDEASVPTHPDASHPASSGDAASSDLMSQASGDDSSQDENQDDASADDAGDMPGPGAEPASPCPVCSLGTTCCTKAGSAQYGTCYSDLCFGLCCN